MSRTKKLTRLRKRERAALAAYNENTAQLVASVSALKAELREFRRARSEMRATGRTSRVLRDALLYAATHNMARVYLIAHTQAYAKTLRNQIGHVAKRLGFVSAVKVVAVTEFAAPRGAADAIFFDHHVFEIPFAGNINYWRDLEDITMRMSGSIVQNT